jgi:hypothetical protein
MMTSYVMVHDQNKNMCVNHCRIYLGVRVLFGQCSKHPFEAPEYMEACRRHLHNYLYDGVNYARNKRGAFELQKNQHGLPC